MPHADDPLPEPGPVPAPGLAPPDLAPPDLTLPHLALPDEVLAAVRDGFGIRPVATQPITGGLSGSRVWQVRDDTAELWTVKTGPASTRFGLQLMADAAASGLPGLLAPRSTSIGRPWVRLEDRVVSVMPWIVGADAFVVGLGAEQWRALGAALGTVHASAAPVAPRPARRGIRRIGRSGMIQLACVDEVIARQYGRPSDLERGYLARIWSEHRRRIDRLARVDRRLKAERMPAARVPCHGDPHIGNVVLDEAGQPWLIDFDDATIAPREVDLVLIELGVIFSQPITDADRRAFYDGYGPIDLDQDRITRFGCVRAIEDVCTTMIELAETADPERTRALSAVLDGILGQQGLVALVEARL